MAKKKDREREEGGSAPEYYKLNTKAVDDLVTADVTNSPKVSQEELDKYRSGSGLKLSDAAKAILVKIWFAGSVCFFIFWGLGTYLTDQLDMLAAFGVVLGMVTDILVNNIFRHFAETPGANDRWMMFPKRQLSSFFLNILYAILLLFCVSQIYNGINYAVLAARGGGDTVPLGVEPILFGVFYTAVDLLFLAMKHFFQQILADAKQSVGPSQTYKKGE